jgi:hypothetical protein
MDRSERRDALLIILRASTQALFGLFTAANPEEFERRVTRSIESQRPAKGMMLQFGALSQFDAVR